jgi:hypothetical protein
MENKKPVMGVNTDRMNSLGIKYLSLETTIKDTIESCLKKGFLK